MDNSCHSVAGTGITTMIHGPLLHNPSTAHSTSKPAWADLSGPFADKTQALVAEGPVFLVTVPVSNQDHFTCPYSIIADQGWTKRHPRGTPNATLFLPSLLYNTSMSGSIVLPRDSSICLTVSRSQKSEVFHLCYGSMWLVSLSPVTGRYSLVVQLWDCQYHSPH